jgi:GT2 family glycosyltransferase
MHVAISIVGFRNRDDITRCLAALERSTHADFEVIICENGGPAAFQALSEVLPGALPTGQRVRAVLASGNLGYAGGVNVCLRETPEADAWWVLNPDTQPEPDALALQVARLSAGDCEAVGSTIFLSDGRVQSHGGRWSPWLARAESIGHGSALSLLPDPAGIEDVQNYLNGASMMISRRFLEVVGLMREDYFLYCEEVEWCLRGVQLGMRLGFAPNARVLHFVGTTTGSYDAITRRPRTPIYLNERNKMLTTWDRYPNRIPVAALASLLLIFVRFGRARAWRQIGYGVAGWAAGLARVRGAPRWLPT